MSPRRSRGVVVLSRLRRSKSKTTSAILLAEVAEEQMIRSFCPPRITHMTTTSKENRHVVR
jgi:hypothetical protein